MNRSTSHRGQADRSQADRSQTNRSAANRGTAGRSAGVFAAALFASSLALGLGFAGPSGPDGEIEITTTSRAAADAPLAPVELQSSCGDGRCQPPEDCHSCAGDCGSCCGNGRCEPPEDGSSCPRDCS